MEQAAARRRCFIPVEISLIDVLAPVERGREGRKDGGREGWREGEGEGEGEGELGRVNVKITLIHIPYQFYLNVY